MDGQPADITNSADDGVYMRGEDVPSDPGQCDVFTESGAKEYVRIVGLCERRYAPFCRQEARLVRTGPVRFSLEPDTIPDFCSGK